MAEKSVFLLEIGTEEIPAGYIGPALDMMARQIEDFFRNNRIGFEKVETAGTPRRLVLVAHGVDMVQEPAVQEITGPPYSIAFTPDGKPTKAAEGFARGLGVSVDELQVKDTPKGKYLFFVKEEKGRSTKELLAEYLPDFVAHIPFPKSMRWGDQTVTFARPIHWIVALLGDEVVPFSYGDVVSGRHSKGHRFMKPDVISVPSDFDEYKKILRDHFVIVDRNERKEMIRSSVKALAESLGGIVVEDEDLLDEVTHLVEYPYPLVGKFEEKYLELPPEVPITVMKEHQRYFALTDARGKLMPYFITVANTVPRRPEVVAQGNERVVRARLEDARFYYEEDKKIPLEKRAEELKNVVFHSKLGTSWEKVERFRAVAKWLSDQLQFDESQNAKLMRAALLCKADLVTGMVSEFPELQGVMGRAYALHQGEDPDVAEAIYEHYLPAKAGDVVPSGIIGAVLSIADKIDTIVGCFGVGLIPTGTADPFALRRQTLAIIRILLEKELPISLVSLVRNTIPGLRKWITEPENTVIEGVIQFFKGRLEHYLQTHYGYPIDVIQAALSVEIDVLVNDVKRIAALSEFRKRSDFNALATTFKRVVNIIKEPVEIAVKPELFEDDAERELWKLIQDLRERFRTWEQERNYGRALEEFASLRPAVDRFFDAVLVMAKETEVRNNRLALLSTLKSLFENIADFKMIQTEV
ncbi:glycine--tRNA ligase subunit beta [Thermodesulforhabdus norvegica]|uniref:Glycine--tRNA ligase beta subunit n=1 Tax=Thermodesulforhabdus norvegica TaxID=39841 RepID=A0A1I4R1W2_9BACT|nr:glycine--tRNA ligase subunit beta [Thermodesulforhabdus norvegica]SFM46268.1 glycyl-tRNA synthetase beta chain [Thermodesulforhabdus norvegica]